jgi:hypothetical protein
MGSAKEVRAFDGRAVYGELPPRRGIYNLPGLRRGGNSPCHFRTRITKDVHIRNGRPLNLSFLARYELVVGP